MEAGSIGAIIDAVFKTYGPPGAIIGVLLWFIKYLLDKNDSITKELTAVSVAYAKVTAENTAAINRVADGLISNRNSNGKGE